MRKNRCYQGAQVTNCGVREMSVKILERDRDPFRVQRASLEGAQDGLDVLEGRTRKGSFQPFYLPPSASESSVTSAAYSRSSARYRSAARTSRATAGFALRAMRFHLRFPSAPEYWKV